VKLFALLIIPKGVKNSFVIILVILNSIKMPRKKMINISESLKKEDLYDCSEDFFVKTISDLQNATSQDLSFATSPKFAQDLTSTKASVVFTIEPLKDFVPKNTKAFFFKNPYLAIAKISKYFASPIIAEGEDAKIGKNTKILKNVFLGKNTKIGDNCKILPGAYIGNDVKIGDNCTIYPNVTIYDQTEIGNNAIIHAGSVIGSDGFGYVQDENFNHHKIYHIGIVKIENDVEIGANTAIDRAVFGTTTIKAGTKLDNLVHIGHNCQIGSKCVIAGQTGFAGSSIIGSKVMFGAQSGVAGHLKVGDGAIFAARSGITKSLEGNGKIYAGFPILEKNKWLKIQAKLSRLIK